MADETRKLLNDAVIALQVAKTRIKKLESKISEPIAIISMACRLPGAISNPEEYWNALKEEKDVIEEFPKDRWDLEKIYDPNPEIKGKSYCKEGGFLKDIDKFDASFFGIAPREANSMDPQQRIVLELVWETLERVGILPYQLNTTKTGVYIGSIGSDYGSNDDLEDLVGYPTGKLGSVISGRVAYTLGLQGPAVTIDTACSSSLVAVHLACQALRLGECNLALAGGVQIMNTPTAFIEFSRLKGLAKDGRCKSFSSLADGAGWGEGCGIILLKRLSDAQKDKDQILAIIKGTAVNQDGHSQGLTAPNGVSQQQVIEKALDLSELKPEDIDAIEAHGTGTSLGDPIEADSLIEVFSRTRPKDKPLYLGSSKSNIGHCQATAGIAGVIKMVLAIEHQKLPKTLYAETPSPYIKWEGSGLELLSQAKEWKRSTRVRRCGISSFGVSGTNSHLILEEPPVITNIANDDVKTSQAFGSLLLLSGQTEEALRSQAAQYAEHIEAHPEQSLEDICHSAANYRTHFSYRLSLKVVSRERLIRELREYSANGYSSTVKSGVAKSSPKLCALFPGQGSQYAGMAYQLYKEVPFFREVLDKCASIVDPLIKHPILSLMFAQEGSKEAELLNQTEYTQVALFSLQYSLYQLWKEWGLEPLVLLGHSIGELLAATVAGVFSPQNALTIAVKRGKLMASLPQGSMLSLELDEQKALELIEPFSNNLSIAAINSPNQTVISGEKQAIDMFLSTIKEKNIRYKELKVSHAFHSQMMQSIVGEFEKKILETELKEPTIAIASNLSGKLETKEFATAKYWSRHIRETVRLLPSIEAVVETGVNTFIEIGPQPVLSALAVECLQSRGNSQEYSYITCLKAKRSDMDLMVDAIGSLWVNGFALDWKKILPGKFVKLPTYPFQRQRYCTERKAERKADIKALGIKEIEHPLLGAITEVADEAGYILSTTLSLKQHPWLGEHKVFDTVILPATAYLELAWAASEIVGASNVEQLTMISPIVLTDQPLQLQLKTKQAGEQGNQSFAIFSRGTDSDKWVENAIGLLSNNDRTSKQVKELGEWPPFYSQPIELNGFYRNIEEIGLSYGTSFQCLKEVYSKAGEIFARVELNDEETQQAQQYFIHPALLDSVLHSLFFGNSVKEKTYLPFQWRNAKLYAKGAKELYIRARIDNQIAYLSLYDSTRTLLAEIEELELREANATQIHSVISKESDDLYKLQWQTLESDDKLQVIDNSVIIGNANVGQILDLPLFDNIDQLLSSVKDKAPKRIIIDLTGYNIEEDSLLANTTINNTKQVLEQLQILLREASLSQSELIWVTRQAISTGVDDELLDLTHSGICGLIRSVRNEYPNLHLRLIDIDSTTSKELLMQAIEKKLEPELAIRVNKLLAPRVVSINKTDSLTIAQGAKSWNSKAESKGTVLITGGTGELGALLAEHLVKEYRVKSLLLTSRKGLDAPKAVELKAKIEALGANVEIKACDVTNYNSLKKIIENIEEDKPLEGVIHTVGILDDGVVAEQSSLRFTNVMSPKVIGAWNLHLLTKDKDLQLFVMFSSLAGIIGSPGQSNYSSANTFLDSLAAYRQKLGLAAQSLAWGFWQQEGGGMTSHLKAADLARMKRQGLEAMSYQQGLELFDRSILQPLPLLIPACLNLSNLTQEKIAPIFSAIVKRKVIRKAISGSTGKTGSSLIQKLSSLPESDRFSAMLSIVKTHIANVLALPNSFSVPSDQPLRELGFDSLMAIDLKNLLSSDFEMDLPSTLIFNYPTAKDITNFLLSKVSPLGVNLNLDIPDYDEKQIQQALATLSVQQLKKAGLLEQILSLLDLPSQKLGDNLKISNEQPLLPDNEEMINMSLDELETLLKNF